MFCRLPGNVVIILISLILASFYFLQSNIFPISIPQYITNPNVTPSIIHFQDQLQVTTATTISKPIFSVTTTAPCTCPTSTDHQTPPNLTLSPLAPEQETLTRLRAAGIQIIFKTGAQEASSLSIQLSTVLRHLSPRDILFFSDAQGTLGPFTMHDTLRNVDQALKELDPDFEIYREIKRYQRTGQDISELTEERSKGDFRSGWKLDKYKFIHMVEQAFEKRPDAKWYVFIETDSYLFLDNVAAWLSRFDSTKPIFLGSSLWSGSVMFAHGGSGYVLSNAAMNKFLGPEQPQGLAASWDQRMTGYCCGDIALASALQERGVLLTVAHPLLNGYKPTTFTYGPDNHWCQPVVNMHHLLPHEVSSVWRYERRREKLGNFNATIFADLYAHFVEPHLVESRDDWDNLSHGPTYTEPNERGNREQKTAGDEKALKEKEERKKGKQAKAKTETEKESANAVEKGRGEVKKGHDQSDEKSEKETGKEENGNPQDESNGKKPSEKGKEKDGNGKPYDESKDRKPNGREKEKEEGEKSKSHDDSKDRMRSEKEQGQEKENEKNQNKEDHSETKATNSEKQIESETSNPSDPKPKDPDSQKEKEKPLQPRSSDSSEEPSPLQRAEKAAWKSFQDCHDLCEVHPKCFQFVYYGKTCKLGLSFRLGRYEAPSEGGKMVWRSGWLVERIREWTRVNACQGPEWPDIRINGE